MKNLMTLVFALTLSSALHSQDIPVDSITNKITYVEIFKKENTSAKELYDICKEWFSETYKDSREVLQVDDADKPKLKGKALFRSRLKNGFGTPMDYGWIYYDITLNFKEGKVRGIVTNFYHESKMSGQKSFGDCENLIDPKAKKIWRKQYKYMASQIDVNTKDLLASLEEYILNYKKSEDSDW